MCVMEFLNVQMAKMKIAVVCTGNSEIFQELIFVNNV